ACEDRSLNLRGAVIGRSGHRSTGVSQSLGTLGQEVAVPAGQVLIDKLLATVIGLKASDLHISCGQPPVIRHHNRLKRLDTKVLDSDDTTALMKSITPDRCQNELQERGGTDFAIAFGDTRFRCAVFKQKQTIGMVLRRIPSQFLTFEQIGMPD